MQNIWARFVPGRNYQFLFDHCHHVPIALFSFLPLVLSSPAWILTPSKRDSSRTFALHNIFRFRNGTVLQSKNYSYRRTLRWFTSPAVVPLWSPSALKDAGSLYAQVANEMTMENGGIHSNIHQGLDRDKEELRILSNIYISVQPGYGTSYITVNI